MLPGVMPTTQSNQPVRDFKAMRPLYAMQEQVEKALSGIQGVVIGETPNGKGGYDVVARIPVQIINTPPDIETELAQYKAAMLAQIDAMTPEQFEQVKAAEAQARAAQVQSEPQKQENQPATQLKKESAGKAEK